MKVTRKDGSTTCRINTAERTTMERAHAILEQLAYHYRHAKFGSSMQLTADSIDVLLADKEMVPDSKLAEEQDA